MLVPITDADEVLVQPFTKHVSVSATGKFPYVVSSRELIDFGAVNVDASEVKTFTLMNKGSVRYINNCIRKFSENRTFLGLCIVGYGRGMLSVMGIQTRSISQRTTSNVLGGRWKSVLRGAGVL